MIVYLRCVEVEISWSRIRGCEVDCREGELIWTEEAKLVCIDMFALHRARLQTHSIYLRASHNSSSRRFFVQDVCNGFLDLAIALPLPPSLPPYSSAIILVTIVSRFALLPISIWVRFLFGYFQSSYSYTVYGTGTPAHAKTWRYSRTRNSDTGAGPCQTNL